MRRTFARTDPGTGYSVTAVWDSGWWNPGSQHFVYDFNDPCIEVPDYPGLPLIGSFFFARFTATAVWADQSTLTFIRQGAVDFSAGSLTPFGVFAGDTSEDHYTSECDDLTNHEIVEDMLRDLAEFSRTFAGDPVEVTTCWRVNTFGIADPQFQGMVKIKRGDFDLNAKRNPVDRAAIVARDGAHIDDQDEGYEPGCDVDFDGDIDAADVDLFDQDTCLADVNGDDYINSLDYIEYLNLFNASDPAADFDFNGTINTLDYMEFLNRYNAGC